MQINNCLRCNRPWCYRGTGRATRCGVCKSPYWDRPRSSSVERDASAAGMRSIQVPSDSGVSGDILHHRGLGTSVHWIGESSEAENIGACKGAQMVAGGMGKMDGMEQCGVDSTKASGREIDSHAQAKHKHSEQIKKDLRDICAGIIKSEEEHHSTLLGAGLIDSEHEVAICGKTWWEDGTQFECLMDAEHRSTKHGQGGMVRKIDD